MARFPRIQSPCPYKSDLAAVMDGDFCRMCKRNVHDLTGWTDAARVAFLAGCETEVCVSYRLPVRSALAAAALVAALPAAAQDMPAQDVTMPQIVAAAPDYAAADANYANPGDEDLEIFVGGITNPGKVEFVEDPADAAIPELPVVYEAAGPAKPPVSGS